MRCCSVYRSFLTLLVVTGLLLSGCGPVMSPSELNRVGEWENVELEPATFAPGTTLRLLVWERYFDPEVIAFFAESYGVTIEIETVSTNEEMLHLIQAEEEPYDLAMPTGYMVEKMAQEGLLSPLQPDLLPASVGVPETHRHLSFDPQAKYSMPYYYGALGFGFNLAHVEGLPTSSKVVLGKENRFLFQGHAAFPDDARFSLGAALLFLGYSANSTNEDEILEAAKLLKTFRSAGNQFLSDTVVSALVKDEISLALMWSGDATLAASEKPDVRFLLPDEKVISFFDCFVVPAESEQKELAHFFLNFLLKPKVTGQMSNYSHYMVTNVNARPFIKRTILNGPAAMLPTPQLTAMIESVGEFNEFYEATFAEVKAVEPKQAPAPFPPYLQGGLQYGAP